MNTDLIKAQDVFLSKVNHICNNFGLNNLMAQLYAILYLSDRALSLNDMVERLKISKGSASINIRALERYGAVRRVWVKGSRKDYYEAQMDVYTLVMDRAKSMARNRLLEIDDMVNSSYQILNSINPADNEDQEAVRVFKQRMDKLRALYNKAHSLFDLLNSSLLANMLNIKDKNKGKTETVDLTSVR